MANANLLVTYDPSHAGRAKAELQAVLKEIGKKAKLAKPKIEGVMEATVAKPKEAVVKLGQLCKKKPNLFEVTFHYTPIDKWAKSDIKAMQKTLKGLAKGISQKDKWKMELNKRSYDKYDSVQLIRQLTEVIDRPNVDLEAPQKILRVEILGNRAGISLLKSEEALDVPKLKG